MPYFVDETDFLAHYGIRGQKWGVRRYQNLDGSLTEEGRLRYTKRNGAAKFAKDSLSDLNTATSKKDLDAKIKRWGKTAEESGVMDPNDTLSRFISPGKHDRRLSDIYDNMPTVIKTEKERKQKQVEAYKKNADGHRKEQFKLLDDTIDEFYPNLHEKFGTKTTKETRQYLIDSMKGFNELDPDEVVFQRMQDLPYLLDSGDIDLKTFNKHYDAQAAEDARDMLGYGWKAEDFKRWRDGYQDLKRRGDNFNGYNEISHAVMRGNDYLNSYDLASIQVLRTSDSELYHFQFLK